MKLQLAIIDRQRASSNDMVNTKRDGCRQTVNFILFIRVHSLLCLLSQKSRAAKRDSTRKSATKVGFRTTKQSYKLVLILEITVKLLLIRIHAEKLVQPMPCRLAPDWPRSVLAYCQIWPFPLPVWSFSRA